jgi:endonuclease/exonuclease/phosphatase family metal-dependent hydrolase
METSAARASSPLAPDHPFAPIIVNRPARARGQTLKLIAFNAWGGRHFDRIVDCLRHPPLDEADVILLSEADWQFRRSGGREVAAELAEALGLSFAYVPEFGIRRPDAPPRSFMGNAILSSSPLGEIILAPIPSFPLRSRIRPLIGGPSGLIASAIFGGRPLMLGVAHLNSRATPAARDGQVGDFIRRLPEQGAAIIGGDFNTTTVGLHDRTAFRRALIQFALEPRRLREPERWEPLFDRLKSAGFSFEGANVPRAPTFAPGRFWPRSLRPKLDWIAARGVAPVPGSARVVAPRRSIFEPRSSDHDFVMCQIRWP